MCHAVAIALTTMGIEVSIYGNSHNIPEYQEPFSGLSSTVTSRESG